jgi:tRNA (cmo5U34)-methyltransferase
LSYFSDPEAVARYAEGPVRQVPGFLDLPRMAGLLLAERCESDARVLVLGAGGGLELKCFAQMQPGWTFDGVDPSPEMLKLAAQTLGRLSVNRRWIGALTQSR